jgi:hypothetical protein
MERLVDRFLVEWTLLGLVEQPFVHVAIVGAQRRAEHIVGNVETVDNGDGVGSQLGQSVFQTVLQVLNLVFGDGCELEKNGGIRKIVQPISSERNFCHHNHKKQLLIHDCRNFECRWPHLGSKR